MENEKKKLGKADKRQVVRVEIQVDLSNQDTQKYRQFDLLNRTVCAVTNTRPA